VVQATASRGASSERNSVASEGASEDATERAGEPEHRDPHDEQIYLERIYLERIRSRHEQLLARYLGLKSSPHNRG
jgi:hypothetical protein